MSGVTDLLRQKTVSASNILGKKKKAVVSPGSASPSNDRISVDSPTQRFATAIPHQFPLIEEQAKNGGYLLKHMRDFFGKVQGHIDKSAAELKKIIAFERKKIEGMADPDGMASVQGASIQLFALMEQVADCQLQFASEIDQQICVPLINAYNGHVDKSQALKDQARKIVADFDQVKVSVNKDRIQCRALLQDLADKREINNEAKNPTAQKVTSPPTAGRKSGIGNMFAKGAAALAAVAKPQDTAKAMDKARERAQKACASYREAVNVANEHHETFHQQTFPAVLDGMQKLEETRIDDVHNSLFRFASVHRAFVENQNALVPKLEEMGSSIDYKSDISMFVANIVARQGEMTEPLPFTYDMGVSPEELNETSFTVVASVFNNTLEGVVAFQEKQDPDYKGEVPRVVPTLINLIEANGGLTEKGLFRISVSSDDLQFVRKQLNGGNYDIKDNNPHLAAALLKAWLRDLAEPLIPTNLYDKCVRIGARDPAKIELAREAVARGVHHNAASDVALLDAEMEELLKAMPALNLRVLSTLVLFLRKVASPENVEENRMTLPNLAIVFAPSLLRSPLDDPLQMLADTQVTVQFLWLLFALPRWSNVSR